MTLTQILQLLDDFCRIDIQFFGRLTQPKMDTNPKGKTLVFYGILPWEGTQTLVVSTECFLTEYNEVVYWLPWQQRSIESVTWDELEDSGCSVILTSEFSGCRLSITDRGIAHTAFGQVAGCDSFARDLAEWEEFVAGGGWCYADQLVMGEHITDLLGWIVE